MKIRSVFSHPIWIFHGFFHVGSAFCMDILLNVFLLIPQPGREVGGHSSGSEKRSVDAKKR